MWNESSTGRKTKLYLPIVNTKYLSHNKFLNFFLTDHGPFINYLHRFKISNTNQCTCGSIGDADHYFFCCPFTSIYHFKKPNNNLTLWFKNLSSNRLNIIKIQNIFKIIQYISDTLV